MDLRKSEHMTEPDTGSAGSAPSEEAVRVCNHLGGSVWTYHEESDRLRKLHVVDFSEFHDLEKRYVLQEILLYSVTGGMGWADEKNRLAVTSLACVCSHILSCRVIYDWWLANACDLSLASFGIDDIVRLCRGVLQNHAGENRKPSAGVYKRLTATINSSNRYYIKGSISDGFLYSIPQLMRRDIVEPLLKPLGIHYSEWRRYGSHGCIPVDVGLTFFMEAAKIIRSGETKILLAYFEAYRHSPPINCETSAGLRAFERYRVYQKTGSFFNSSSKKSHVAWKAFGQKFDEQGMKDVNVLPWQTVGEFTGYCRLVRSACNALLHLVAGNRLHEVAGYQTGQWFQDDKGVWWYCSKEYKVNKGANADRSIDPIGAEAARILTHMSYLDPDDQRPLFCESFFKEAMQLGRKRKGLLAREECYEEKEQEAMTNKTLRNWFSSFYQTHLVQRHPEMGKKHPHVVPHQARSFWADVALRWIDPKYCDVIGEIREQFRHAGPTMVYSYTDGKRSQDIQREAEKRYMLEILERVARHDPDDPWFGAAAKRIRNEAASITVMSPEALADFVEEQSDLYSRFIVWEWGMCAVRTGEEAKANCSDSETGIPNLLSTDRKMQPEVCFGCPHQMAHKGFKNRIERIG